MPNEDNNGVGHGRGKNQVNGNNNNNILSNDDFNSTHHTITGLTLQEYNFNMAVSGTLSGFVLVLILLLFVAKLK